MKHIKIKRSHNHSFVSNHDLLEGLRNHSFVATRDNTTRLHTNPSKISLIERKNYSSKENQSFTANSPDNFTPSSADKTIILIQDCLSILGAEGNQAITHKLRKALSYVREMQEEHIKDQESRKNDKKQGEKALIHKLETNYQEKMILKMQIEELKLKLSQCRQKLLVLKKQRKSRGTINSNPTPISQNSLQDLIVNQSQVINRQCEERKRQQQEMRRLLEVQALQIESMMKQRQKINQTAPIASTTPFVSLKSRLLLR